EYHWCEVRAPKNLVHQRKLDLAETRPAELGAQVAGPQPPFLHDLLQRAHQGGEARIVDIPLAAQHEVEGLDLVAYELIDPVQLALEVCVGLEVPCHILSPLVFFSVMCCQPQARISPPSTGMV